MQIQMAVLFFYSGISKMGGDDWRGGDAVWNVFTTDEHYNSFILSAVCLAVLAGQFRDLRHGPHRDRVSVS